ncbi:hypothetical protein EBU71_10005 [bacterium]|jgi:hypothetical protein|nr:hypothetical protein [Candidatus Elulimicrobium humile]
MIIFISVLSLILFLLLATSIFYLIRFARIIMIIEDDFSDAIEALEDTEKTLEKILGMRLFFDSKEVQLVVKEAMAEVKNNKMSINRVALKFVERSKQKYTVIVEEEPDIREIQERLMRERFRRGEMMDEIPQEINR